MEVTINIQVTRSMAEQYAAVLWRHAMTDPALGQIHFFEMLTCAIKLRGIDGFASPLTDCDEKQLQSAKTAGKQMIEQMFSSTFVWAKEPPRVNKQ